MDTIQSIKNRFHQKSTPNFKRSSLLYLYGQMFSLDINLPNLKGAAYLCSILCYLTNPTIGKTENHNFKNEILQFHEF